MQATLISGLASDTATLYLSAAQAAQALPYAATNSKFVAYANWKSTSFQAYAHAFAGMLALDLLASGMPLHVQSTSIAGVLQSAAILTC